MKPEKRSKAIEVEVLPPRGSLISVVYRFFCECPPVRSVSPPNIRVEDLEAGFAHRLGISVIFLLQSAEHGLSPEGSLRALAKIILKWFAGFFLLACCILVLAWLGSVISETIHQSLVSLKLALWEFIKVALMVCAIAAVVVGAIIFLLTRK